MGEIFPATSHSGTMYVFRSIICLLLAGAGAATAFRPSGESLIADAPSNLGNEHVDIAYFVGESYDIKIEDDVADERLELRTPKNKGGGSSGGSKSNSTSSDSGCSESFSTSVSIARIVQPLLRGCCDGADSRIDDHDPGASSCLHHSLSSLSMTFLQGPDLLIQM